MRNRILKITAGFLAFLFAGTLLHAQEKISMSEAIEYALQHKADAVKAALGLKTADNEIMDATSAALPKINASGALNYNPILQKMPLPGELLGEPGQTLMVPFALKWGASAGVQLEQMLFSQQVFIGLKAARTTQEFYQINKQLTEEQLIENVATAYYQVFVQKENLRTIEDSYRNTERIRNVIQSLYENGLAKRIDLDRTNVALTNIETSRTQLENAVTLTENALKFYIGMPIETPVELEPVDVSVTPMLLADEMDTDDRTEVKLLEKKQTLLGYNVQAIKAGFYPTLSLVGNYAWQSFANRFPIGAGKSKGVYWTDAAGIGVQLNVPIFNGFMIKAKVNKAKIELESLEQDLKDTRLGMNLQYRNAKVQMENNLKAISAQEANVSLAEKVLSDSNSNYQYGLAPLTDVLDAENSLVQAKNNYNNALLNYKIAEIQLLKSRGALEELRKEK